LLESIWKSSQIIQPHLCPLNDYLNHIVRQSRISVYTLKCAIIYFVRISRQLQDKRWESKIRLFCGRRMFLGSVIIASKYLYDRTYSNSMWAKLLCLDIKEVNNIQMDFLEALNYDLYISKELDCVWSQMLENFISYLKVKQDENSTLGSGSEIECKNAKSDVLSSPISSPAMSLKVSNYSFMHGMYQVFPISPISPATSAKTMNTLGADESIKTLKMKIMENQRIESAKDYPTNIVNKEVKRLEEYRPFVKVLIQVIFMYSKNNALPVGEKRVIELPKLATTPDQLFINPESSRYNRYASNPLMYQSKNAFLQLKRCIKTSKNISKAKKVQLNRMFFNKIFPNRHPLYYQYPRANDYNSDHIAGYSNSFQSYRSHVNVLNDRPYVKTNNNNCSNNINNEDNDHYFQEEKLKVNRSNLNNYKLYEGNENLSSSSSSDWDSMSDDNSTLIGSSEIDIDIENNDEDYTPTPIYDNVSFFEQINYKKVEENKVHMKKAFTILTPQQDNEMYFSTSKTLLPTQSKCHLTSSILKPLHHPKIVYPK